MPSSKSDLEGANLSGADLMYSNFSNTNLKNANLTKANARGANFANANLSKVKANGIVFKKTNLKGAKLISADLSEARLWHLDLITDLTHYITPSVSFKVYECKAVLLWHS